MLDSDSGSSELSDASSLSSDNSSGSEADVSKDKPQSTALRNKQQYSTLNRPSLNPSHPPLTSTHRIRQHGAHASLSLSASGSDDGSNSEESSGADEDIAHNRKNAKSSSPNAPISLSASKPVYSQEVMNRSMMLMPANAKYNAHSQTPTSSRGRGRGRGRALLSGHRPHKYDATSTTVIDFEGFSTALEDSKETKELASSKAATPASVSDAASTTDVVRKKKGADQSKLKDSRSTSGTNGKQKLGSRKVGRPKSVSKDVYCVCRGPYDGVEFMIACDRCEEWFHGRCIEMKPQEAKKSSHYYCDTCQKIRRMFGVVTAPEEYSKPSKSTGKIKKSSEKRSGKQHAGVSSSEDRLPLLKIKVESSSRNSQSYNANPISSFANSTSAQAATDPTPFLHRTQIQPHFSSKPASSPSRDHIQSSAALKQIPDMVEDRDVRYVTHYDTTSITSVSRVVIHWGLTNKDDHFRTSIADTNYFLPDRVSQDDDEEDICPICDFECTCNANNNEDSMRVTSPVAKSMSNADDVHALTAIKVPFQPSLGLQSGSATHDSDAVDAENHRSFLNAEKRPVIRAESSSTTLDEAFHTSAKNPMSIPSTQRRLSVIRRGGKSIGKYPMKESRSQYGAYSRGKSIKSGKANIFIYKDSRIDLESDISNEFSDDDDDQDALDSDQGGFSHSLDDVTPTQTPTRYESDAESDGADDMNDSLSMGSSSSLSDVEGDSARPIGDLSPRPKGSGKIVIGKKWSRPHVSNSTGLSFVESNSTAERSQVVKKRGPGRPKKIRDPLIVSREDEMTLYTPAVAARKLIATYPQKGESSKPIRVTVKPKARAELPFIAYDPEVAEDVMALNSLDNENEVRDGTAKAAIATPQASGSRSEAFSEGDIFGDGDLSDELSGDLSDIMSEDFDDLSGESLDFSSSDEEDETSSSSPREFNYSEMEEQDESLVDSDSSLNSITSDSSDSSDLETETASDEDEEIVVYDHEGSEESIDEEELLILEEQERLILAKAHGLLDVFSEEDSDPDRNPFESSEDDDDDEEDERVFDGDDDDVYSDEYYDDDYPDDEYEEMDEQAILAQLKGVQSDIQALMMIPPEQQEQLLLLQHYEEAHRQQQQQDRLQPQGQEQLSQDQFQNSQSQETQSQELDPQQGAQMANLLETSSFLPQFDINVPDLDAVSQQLAASLADSIAKSMAGAKQALEGSLLSEAAMDGDISIQPIDPISTESSIGAPLNVSPRSTSSLSPGPLEETWSAPLPSSPNSLDSNSASIPTPANTPTPSGAITGTSPSIPGSSGMESQQQSPGGSSSGLAQKQLVSQGKIQSLSHSPTYKPLTSTAVSTIGGPSIQPIQPRLSSGEKFPESFTRIQDAGSAAFKEEAQKALDGIGGNCSNLDKSIIPESEMGTIDAPKIGLDSGNTSDDTSLDAHTAETRKRKGEDIMLKETRSCQGKRRHLLIGSTKGDLKNETLISVPTPESEVSLPSSSLSSPPVSSLSVESITPFHVTTTNSSVDSPSSFSVTPTAELTPPLVYDFTKAVMPFMDPSARIFSSNVTQRRGSASQSLRMRKNSLKGKEPKQQTDVMPMDDLLDTSALYGRSSSRSPSPDRAEVGEEGDNEISRSMLKDLNRWERVPIGTFRRSRRPSSPYVGLQGALKFGNATMPATLLADHQQHQQQLHRESQRRIHKRPPGARKHRNPTPLVSDVGSQGRRPEDLSQSLHGDKLLRRRRRAGSSSNGSLTHIPRLGSIGGLHMPSSGRRISKYAGSGLSSDMHVGLGVGLGGLTDSGITMDSTSNSSSSASRTISSSGVGGVGVGKDTDNTSGIEALKDLMTDSSQLPSSACPTPLHSPLFSATTAGSRVLHHSSGEPVVMSEDQSMGKVDGIDSRGEDSIVSHLELDIGKEMDGFHESLLAKTKAKSDKK
ncbi:hypothetical protein BGZ80_008498 [Entomortierella chlamydospora]|uniref:PHD-type domain-containing protein n=1 Tax=Entomortierella chlamydospora TaxID=101097 RepID=A0A9P6T197_9FUNG|nr:hypothetical protein BGZ79_006911 [Entomortierella chlamydospora]KAG0017240.1 hypothetical protein BGZ80_008498 [Entomortierella chlamydospora]